MAFRDRIYLEDGSEVGEAVCASVVNPGEVILTGPGRRWLVLELVSTDEESDEYAGLLRVAAAAPA